jgi:hypothetical protein
MTAILAISYAVGVVAFAHAALRPASAWAHADRQRAYWLSLLGFLLSSGSGCWLLPCTERRSSRCFGVKTTLRLQSDSPGREMEMR